MGEGGWLGERERSTAGSAAMQLVEGVALLRPEEQVFEAMLTGWRQQQLSRNLAVNTIANRDRRVRGFVDYVILFRGNGRH